MSHGTPEITKEINEAMRGLVGGTEPYARIMARVQHYMPTKLTEMAAAHGSDRHDHTFGLSGAGGCVRKAQLAAMGERITFSPGKLFTFAIGHLLEPFALALLEECGWTIVEPQAEVVIPGEHGLPLFHSWTDGIIERHDFGRIALSTKTMGYKNSALFRGKATRRGFTALPFEGASEAWRAQSQLEMYGLKLDQALIMVLSKEYMEVFETEDIYMKESGSAVVWTDVMEAQPKWVEAFILPTWREAQRAVLAGELSDGKILHKETGMYRATDPRQDNKKSGWDWDRCKWSTGACDMRAACMAAYK